MSEYIPYTILRLVLMLDSKDPILVFHIFSMVAEIGGLAGIMIGFSILDFINLCDNAKQMFNVLHIWK